MISSLERDIGEDRRMISVAGQRSYFAVLKRMLTCLQKKVSMFMRIHSFELFIGLGFGHVSGIVYRFRMAYFSDKRVTMTF
jgi:hypothetical protein